MFMNHDPLKQGLDSAGVPEWRYNLTGVGAINNKYVMERKNGKWHTFFSERGQEMGSKDFDREDEACGYFLKRVLAGEKARLRSMPLPLGSVVRLKGAKQKLMVVSRAQLVSAPGGKQYYFSYGAVPYPQGLVTTEVTYFQRGAVEKVYHWGYSDEEDLSVLDGIHRFMDAHPEIERGNAVLVRKLDEKIG